MFDGELMKNLIGEKVVFFYQRSKKEEWSIKVESHFCSEEKRFKSFK